MRPSRTQARMSRVAGNMILKCPLSRHDLCFKEIFDPFITLCWWKLFDTSETRSDVEDLSFQTDNREQHDEGTFHARGL
jgi:hypothetical protein